MTYLGIDYGKRKIGLAISEGDMAGPYGLVYITSLKDGVEKVLQIIRKENIEKVVVGVAESGESRAITLEFIKQLKKRGLEVVETEETLSSQAALGKMLELGTTRRHRQTEDAFAAVEILQVYLDRINS